MIRTIALILVTLAIMAAVQTRLESRLGLHASLSDATFDSRSGLRS